jgi:hypothetical protein
MGLMERIQERIETTARMHGGSRKAVGGLETMERLENLEELLERLEAPGRSERFVDSRGQRPEEGFRMRELEAENLRLNRLVAELLLKNQQLREAS